ncbi:hypothetical protein BTJ40_05605 [Microbulbifer sp. A4B17]|uniref:right-handed parallel beta-helix repeat-containing protein n=1 Tax=Microbulbifer sp. A4B17 TaxID=359370 RepID=UPI000D52D07F|nr:right-handed parallel beta-helix repeat-containing protein [Microbulbifer sp. A4B17]AWF80327.1 hypothetical protein BTJ40_05605 [Microbulbifer sp. A4B17]
MSIRRFIFCKIVLTNMFVCVTLAASLSAFAIDCGDVITTSEVLDRNLVCNVSPALSVEGPSGSLNLDGFSVVCDGTSRGISLDGVAAFLTGGDLMNGAVRDCGLGINAGENGFHTIQGVIVSGSSSAGIALRSEGNTLALSTVQTSDIGVYVFDPNNTIILNEMESNSVGVLLDAGDSLISQNNVNNNTGWGVIIQRSDGSTISQNSVINNGGTDSASAGILMDLFGQQGNFILGNTVTGNQNFDLLDLNINACDGSNVWVGNVFSISEPSCLD